MIQFIRVIVTFLMVGFASTYYLSGSLDLSNTPQLLTLAEFSRNPTLVAVHTAQSGLDANSGATIDLNTAYSSYLNSWSAPSPRPTVGQAFVSPIKGRVHRLYAKIGAQLPTPRTEHSTPAWFARNGRAHAGMIATLAGLLALIVVLHLLTSWLRSRSRA